MNLHPNYAWFMANEQVKNIWRQRRQERLLEMAKASRKDQDQRSQSES